MPDSTPPDSLPDSLKRRFLDRAGATPTLIGTGSQFEGNLYCAGDLAVAGEVRGDGHINGLLTLADTGIWRGQLRCEQAVLAGLVQGDVTVTKKLEIRSSARVHGRLIAQHIAIAAGAVVDGELSVLSGEGVQTFEEKRRG